MIDLLDVQIYTASSLTTILDVIVPRSANTSANFCEFVKFTFISGEEGGEMSPDETATRAKMKEAGYSEEEIQTMIDAGCTEMAD